MNLEKNRLMSKLETAIAIATKAHSGQFDKAGEAYILHPLKLMMKFSSEEKRVVAVLHDVVEDSNISLTNLQEYGFSDTIIEAIDSLTRKESEDYQEFISRLSLNKLARQVKIEDIKHNLDLTRIKSLSNSDLIRVEKYHKALRLLEKTQPL